MKIKISLLVSLCIAAAVYAGAFPGAGGKVVPATGRGASAGQPAAPAVQTISGKALEVLQTASYTYLRIEQGKDSIWAAIPKSEVEKGKVVTIQAGIDMPNFKSRSLDRTFKNIMFSNGLVGKAGVSAPHGTPVPAAPSAPIKVEKAKGPDARSVAEIYQTMKVLGGKSILLRGQVVKVSPEIMGRNWVHIQDGTGNNKTRDDDLLVTTKELPKVGDVVTFRGDIALDQDFGSGYAYAVLMEKAVLQP